MADYISTLTGVQMDSALMDMAEHNSEAWAVGERNGIPVGSDDVTYQNNAQYYAQQAQSIAPASVTEAVRWDIAQTALTDVNKEQARSNIDAGKNGAWSNRNLLDNAYFVGGGSQLGDGVFPINQRGQASYTATANVFDRWKVWDGADTVVLTANGVQYKSPNNNGLFQYFPVDLPTNTMTFSVKVSGTIYSITIAEGTSEERTNIPGGEILVNRPNKTVGIISHNTTLLLQAAKLEVGTVSTLANDPPPDFGEELRKCQRYLFIYRGGYLGWFYGNGSTMYGIINTPVPLRATPTVSFTSNGFISVATGAYVTSAGSFAVDTVNGTTLRMYATLGGAVANGMYLLYLDNGQTLTLSAEL